MPVALTITYLTELDLSFSVIGITETWLQNTGINNSNNDSFIEGYNFIHNYRQDKTGEMLVSLLTIVLNFDKDMI